MSRRDSVFVTRRPRRFSDRKSTRLNSSHSQISYAVFCLKKKKIIARAHRQLFAPAPVLAHPRLPLTTNSSLLQSLVRDIHATPWWCFFSHPSRPLGCARR